VYAATRKVIHASRTLHRSLHRSVTRQLQTVHDATNHLSRRYRWCFRLSEVRLISIGLKLQIFPALAHCRYLDHYFRVIFLPTYAMVVLITLSDVNFGSTAFEKLNESPCCQSPLACY